MKWNNYVITTNGGLEYACVVGDWLKVGKYSFGTVRLAREFTDEETKDVVEVEEAVFDIWLDRFCSDMHEEDENVGRTYSIKTNNGLEYESVFGTGLKDGKYSFGTSRLVREFTEEEDAEFMVSCQAIYSMWYDEFEDCLRGE